MTLQDEPETQAPPLPVPATGSPTQGIAHATASASPAVPVHGASNEHAIAHYETFAETYRQHVDMMLRCIAVYLAIVGTATGFVFTDGAAPERRVALSAFVGIVSAISLVGCGPAFRWIGEMERVMRGYEADLKLRAFPLGGIRDIVAMFGGLALTILLAAIILLVGVI